MEPQQWKSSAERSGDDADARWRRQHNLYLYLWLVAREVQRDLLESGWSRGEVLELLCRHVGLAEAYQWVHVNDLP